MQARNFLLFISLSVLILFGWIKLESVLWPPKPQKKAADSEAKKAEDGTVKPEKEPAKPEKEPVKPKPPVDDGWAGVGRALNRAAAPPSTPEELVTLGSDDRNSEYHLEVVLDPKGAVVRRVILNKFKAATDYGRPTDHVLELVPEKENAENGSFQLFHYADPTDDRQPLDTLGKEPWTPVEEKTEAIEGNRERKTVAFRTTIDGVQITKTFQPDRGRLPSRPGGGLKKVGQRRPSRSYSATSLPERTVCRSKAAGTPASSAMP